MKTAEGVVEFAAPQVRDTAEPFVSGIRQNLAGRPARSRTWQSSSTHADCRRATSKTRSRTKPHVGCEQAAVSEITERLWAEYEAFTTRDLSEYRIVYLFVDGIAERLPAGQAREPVLAAWASARKGARSCCTYWRIEGGYRDGSAFFQDMRGRGLGDPLLVVWTVLQDHPGDRGVLPALRAATLSRASDAQPCRQGPTTCAGVQARAAPYQPHRSHRAHLTKHSPYAHCCQRVTCFRHFEPTSPT